LRNSRKTAAAVAALLSVGLIAAACGGDDDSADTTTTAGGATTTAGGATTSAGGATTTAGGASGGTITYAAEQEYTSYNNFTADAGLFANSLVLNPVLPRGPFYADEKGGLSFDDYMMESAELTSEDPQTVVYKVKPEAVWSDGDPIDCDDWHLSWIAQNGKAVSSTEKDEEGNPVTLFLPVGTFGYEDIESLECSADGKEITTTYSKPYADWKGLFGSVILPAHIVEAKTGVADVTAATTEADLKKVADFWNTGWVAQGGIDKSITPSGGPYMIEEFKPGESLTLVRNDKFWGEPGKADTIVLRQVPDATAQPQALANNEVQVISPQPNEDLLAQIENIGDVDAKVDLGFTFEHFDFNFNNPILQDKAVRQAFALCINRDEIVETLITPMAPDAAVLNNHFYFPFQEQYVDNSGDFGTQDIAKAKSTLEAGGWTLGGDGVYEKGGQKLAFRIGRRDPNPRRQKTIELAIAQCKEAGFNLTEQADATFNSDLLPAGQWDVALFAWVGTPTLGSNTSIYIPKDVGGGQNYGSWVNNEIKGLFDQANAELDEAKRTELMNQIDKLIWDDMATIPLYQFPDLTANKQAVQNVVYNPSSSGITWNAEAWALSA
jgi:peptide/nickel transport system substrate-binding protein